MSHFKFYSAMKAVSDLKESELDEYNIPHEEWEKRVELKKKNKL